MAYRQANRRPMRGSAGSRWAYGFALFSVAIPVAAKLTLVDRTGLGPPLTLLIMPVLVASWLGGRGPGFLATGLASLTWALLYFPQFGSVNLDPMNNLLRLGLFLIEGALASWFIRRPAPVCSPAEARLLSLAARDKVSSRRSERYLRLEQLRSARSASRMSLE